MSAPTNQQGADPGQPAAGMGELRNELVRLDELLNKTWTLPKDNPTAGALIRKERSEAMKEARAIAKRAMALLDLPVSTEHRPESSASAGVDLLPNAYEIAARVLAMQMSELAAELGTEGGNFNALVAKVRVLSDPSRWPDAEPIPPEEPDLQLRWVRAMLIDAWASAWSQHPGTPLIRAALKTMVPKGFVLADVSALNKLRDADLAAQPDPVPAAPAAEEGQ